jgi:hypothetical protein
LSYRLFIAKDRPARAFFSSSHLSTSPLLTCSTHLHVTTGRAIELIIARCVWIYPTVYEQPSLGTNRHQVIGKRIGGVVSRIETSMAVYSPMEVK